MNRRWMQLFLVVGAYFAALPAVADPPIASQAQCSSMVDGLVQAIKEAPMEEPKDKQRAAKIIQRMETTVRENRARGVKECDTWIELGKIVSSQ